MMGRRRTLTVFVEGSCALACPTCDCRVEGWSDERIERELERGGARLILRGAPDAGPRTRGIVRRALGRGFDQIVLRTSGIRFAEPAAARDLARAGVTGVIVPLFSHVPRVNDRLAARPGALVETLKAMRSLDAERLAIELEVPLLSTKLQRLDAVVDLALRAVPSLARIQFFVPRFDVPAAVAPPAWGEGAPALAAALRRARQHGVTATLRAADAVPLCALRAHPDLFDAFVLERRPLTKPPHGCSRDGPCSGCAVASRCSGVSIAYQSSHGTREIVPWREAPPAFGARKPRREVWTEARRLAASSVHNLVLRPTVNCNQDCPFCSANETSRSVWPDPAEMLRRVARAARTGARRISFSGGEPTLSRHLVDYVSAASRLGVENIELVTNGTLLDSERKVRALREAGLTHAFVSLHAHDELLSRTMTAKVGDFERTLRALHLLVEHGVRTEINHVITSRNHAFVEHFVEMVHRELAGRVEIALTFVTPQFKALDNFELVPKLSTIWPSLRAGMWRALELGQPFHVGSRQGIPPCMLGEFRPWSDVFEVSREAIKEDSFQKQHGPGCDDCLYSRYCTGLWRPYVERYGLDELRPVPGPPLDDARIAQIRNQALRSPPRSFEAAHELMRDREAELAGAAWRRRSGPTPPAPVRLEVVMPERSRPLRVALLGTGRQARRLARAASAVGGLSIDALASPHAPEARLDELGHAPRYRDAAEALDDVRPDAAIVAAATPAHFELARAAIERGVHVLLEKPVTHTDEQGMALLELARGTDRVLMPAHNLLFAPGLERLLSAAGPAELRFVRSCPASVPDAPRSWSRAGLFEIVYHAVSVVAHGLGEALPGIDLAQARGSSRPERVRLELSWPQRRAEIVFDFDAPHDELSVLARGDAGELGWRRNAGDVHWLRGERTEPVPRDGSETERMLAAFRDAVLGKSPAPVNVAEALAVQRTAHAAIEALERAGAPFERAGAPKHVRSRAGLG